MNSSDWSIETIHATHPLTSDYRVLMLTATIDKELNDLKVCSNSCDNQQLALGSPIPNRFKPVRATQNNRLETFLRLGSLSRWCGAGLGCLLEYVCKCVGCQGLHHGPVRSVNTLSVGLPLCGLFVCLETAAAAQDCHYPDSDDQAAESTAVPSSTMR
ncbi:hypothetical protein BD289DRAFT_282994 [Coniella lustricola]|uniref:Uncharacterized protein n=1 Tax=Coniella lustricola TaxID=2025994 RepID=A0A2T3A5V2_9PEZI|nr:hypothetical protein BD289DRAFT_282994 [Coniella lustricola]